MRLISVDHFRRIRPLWKIAEKIIGGKHELTADALAVPCGIAVESVDFSCIQRNTFAGISVAWMTAPVYFQLAYTEFRSDNLSSQSISADKNIITQIFFSAFITDTRLEIQLIAIQMTERIGKPQAASVFAVPLEYGGGSVVKSLIKKSLLPPGNIETPADPEQLYRFQEDNPQ